MLPWKFSVGLLYSCHVNSSPTLNFHTIPVLHWISILIRGNQLMKCDLQNGLTPCKHCLMLQMLELCLLGFCIGLVLGLRPLFQYSNSFWLWAKRQPIPFLQYWSPSSDLQRFRRWWPCLNSLVMLSSSSFHLPSSSSLWALLQLLFVQPDPNLHKWSMESSCIPWWSQTILMLHNWGYRAQELACLATTALVSYRQRSKLTTMFTFITGRIILTLAIRSHLWFKSNSALRSRLSFQKKSSSYPPTPHAIGKQLSYIMHFKVRIV